YIPIGWAFNLSFTSWEVRSTPDNYIGFQNYSYVLSEPEFWNAFQNTLSFSVIKIPLDMVLALGIALLLNQKLRGISFFRMAYFLPVITSVVAVAAIWRVIYNPSFGLLNSLLNSLGLPSQRWLRDPNMAISSVAFVSLWKGLGYDIVIFLAGLQSISRMYYEAAEIDGASAWQRFRFITLPLLSPVTFFVLVVSIINSFKVFSLIHVLVPDGGPLNSAEVIVFYLYRLAFQEFKFGRAAAVSFILLAVVLFITYIQRRFIEPRVNYE
ncbi:MAG: sugar ABC transporter permease, partial [Anaerolineae bacterium]|nr:sugar ABC transporter permease [Anaerolineae bacterium]